MEDKSKTSTKKKSAKKKKVSKKKSVATATRKVSKKKVAVKKVASKKAGKKKVAVKKPAKKTRITMQQRYEYIAKAAYYHAEARRFQGDSIEDWLAAEAEVDAAYEVRE